MLKKTLKYFGLSILIYILICLGTPFNKQLRNRSIKNQINYLSELLDSGYDDELQGRFPEGKLFSNCLLALSIIEFCDKNERSNERYSAMVDRCVERIQSASALEAFDEELNPEYGMFYQAWSNLLYSKYIKSDLFGFSDLRDQVEGESEGAEAAFRESQLDSFRILDSYAGANWPADNLIGIVSLKDKEFQSQWLEYILQESEHESKLIHHSGSDKSKVRGSSSAMIVYCLKQCNYPEINGYNETFRTLFVDSYLGLELVKENVDASDIADVDSGPVIWGYGASATVMNIKAQASLGNTDSKSTWAAINLIAVPVSFFNKKYLLLKKEPMFDLFMLWASTEM